MQMGVFLKCGGSMFRFLAKFHTTIRPPQSTSKLCSRSLQQLENKKCCYNLIQLEKLSTWECGSGDSWKNIEELRGLSLLDGSLYITIKGFRREDDHLHLHDVEEKEEVLTNKTNLSRLVIDFDIDGDDVESGCYGCYEQVLRILKPPSNIEALAIWRYKGRRFPKWMEMRSFPRLEKIQLIFMWNVEEWGWNWRHSLPLLEELKIHHCYSLKSLPQELGDLTALKKMFVWKCYELIYVPRLNTGLEILEITECFELESLPQLHLITSLRELIILYCPKLKFVFHGLRHLISLEVLTIKECPWVVIPKGELDQLVALRGNSDFFHIDIDEKLIHDQEDSTTTSETRGNDDDDVSA
ncbi:hypothetical protein Sjap_018338 [Stephania japonica]|uniref:R13L1/DRL21-like LRR repeat region domain-containing protein n=1 Tax=Stephania japonica TaxID=461633 RepID=A0AAP0I7T8_9MAGN